MALHRKNWAGYGDLGLDILVDDDIPRKCGSDTPPMIEITYDSCAKPYHFLATDLDQKDVIIL